MDCPKGCKDTRGKPVEMKGGKIEPSRQGQMVRLYCPRCFHKMWVPARRE